MGSPGAFSALEAAVVNPGGNAEEDMEAIRRMLARAIRDAPGGGAPARPEEPENDGDERQGAVLLGGLRRLRAEAERAQCSGGRDDVASLMLAELRRETLRAFSILEGIAEADTDGGGADAAPRGPVEGGAVGRLAPLRLSTIEMHLV